MINTDKKKGWTGFLPYGYASTFHLAPDRVTSSSSLSRKNLWDWLGAAFPKAVYCLCSATLTDACVLDMRGSANKCYS